MFLGRRINIIDHHRTWYSYYLYFMSEPSVMEGPLTYYTRSINSKTVVLSIERSDQYKCLLTLCAQLEWNVKSFQFDIPDDGQNPSYLSRLVRFSILLFVTPSNTSSRSVFSIYWKDNKFHSLVTWASFYNLLLGYVFNKTKLWQYTPAFRSHLSILCNFQFHISFFTQ